jgi:hypothetical protein
LKALVYFGSAFVIVPINCTAMPARQISLIVTLTVWATLIGGVMYSHVVYFPPYLSHLPASNALITGDYGLHEGVFWMMVHPVAILSTILTLVLNWRSEPKRKLILASLGIYAIAILATALYFVPELMAFADSGTTSTVTPAEWLQRGRTWQHLSWIRGSFMYLAFILLVLALTKNHADRA